MERQVHWFVLGLCFLQFSIIWAQNDPEVTLSTGKIRGLRLTSVVNREYFSFRGIPYAAPPVGDLRFRAPQPPQSWNGTFEAFDIPPACPQPWRKLKFPEKFSEDCLYINVFTPHFEPDSVALMPVMVWIHGGKQYQGSSTSYKYGADFLITEDVILVTFNYRLGVLGYLNLNIEGAQGNAAAKDKVAALRWVQKEIRNFGGDPESVTVFGGSSGGQDVNCIYVTPMAQGLFHRAISQSAPECSSNSSYSLNPGQRLAEILGCSGSDAKTVLDCLRRVPAEVIAEKQMDVVTPGPGQAANPFGLTVEEDHGEEVFLSVPAEELVKVCQSSIPYMTGMNSGEGKMDLDNPEDNPSQFTDFERDFHLYLPDRIREKNSQTTIESIVQKFKKFYFGNEGISYDTVYGFMNFMMDRKFTYPIIKMAKTISAQAPVYLYFFAFEGEFENRIEATDNLNLTGVNHGEELGYLFYRNATVTEQNHMEDYPRECETLTRMVRLWTNFAKYGNPTPNKTDGILDVTWLPMDGNLTRHIIINDSLLMVEDALFPDRVALWESIDNQVLNDFQNSKTIGLTILASVLALSVVSLVYLVYDCTCSNRNRGSYGRI